MILIVQSVYERYPPSENRLKIEKIAALVITPYIGYLGIYENHNQTPVIRSKEPDNNQLLLLHGRNGSSLFEMLNRKKNGDHHHNNRNPNQTEMIQNHHNRSRKISLPPFGTQLVNNHNKNHIIGRINE
ncbi:hypothetical protein BLA29_012393 [Euroglyphus maynei]|uniref:Uncharacterized protein n=1 Tax=Euroglyphus maynei TaxID=6958 RepID=A0A1Y3BLQ9_EURMA|nr:hypothetical protein BLA29_012393 [Euroglyphus maynei]